MIKQKQLYRHRPEQGEIGDCHRTAIACLLDLRPEDVPHFGEMNWDHESRAFREPGHFNEDVALYLAGQGLARVDVVYGGGDLEGVLNMQAHLNPDAYYLLGGESRTGVNHTVIGQGGAIVWDPSLDDSGIVGPCKPDGYYWITYLVPLRLVEKAA